MKNLLVLTVCLTAFSTAHAMTCMSSKFRKNGTVAKISSTQAQLSYEGNVYSTLFLRGMDATGTVYKSVGELSNALKVSNDVVTGKTQAGLYQVSKGGTRLVQVLDICQ